MGRCHTQNVCIWRGLGDQKQKFRGVLRVRYRCAREAKSQTRSKNKLLTHRKLSTYHRRRKPTIIHAAVARGARTVGRCCLTCTHAQTRTHTFLVPKSAVCPDASSAIFRERVCDRAGGSCKNIPEKCSFSAEMRHKLEN